MQSQFNHVRCFSFILKSVQPTIADDEIGVLCLLLSKNKEKKINIKSVRCTVIHTQ